MHALNCIVFWNLLDFYLKDNKIKQFQKDLIFSELEEYMTYEMYYDA
jgi:hypothetical protein